MLHAPMFSIIVPIYKVEKHLQKCIESILEQTYVDFELILVDDGSPDKCPAICDNYAKRDERVKVIHKTNGGLVSARKIGALNAQGDYILNVDGDDFVRETWLEGYASIVQRCSPDCIATGFRKVDEEGSYLDACLNDIQEGLYEIEPLRRICENAIFDFSMGCINCGNIIYSIWSKAIKREIITKAQLCVPETIRNGEDMAVVFPALCECKSLYVMNSTDYCYRQNTQSMTKVFRKDELARQLILFQYLRDNVAYVPRRNIDAYIACQVLVHILRAARHMDNAIEFVQLANEQVTSQLQCSIDGLCIKRWKPLEWSVMQMLKHKLYWLIWLSVRCLKLFGKML